MGARHATLSVRQPWAWAIVRGLKDIENRGWCNHFRGPLLIHAAKKRPPERELRQMWGICSNMVGAEKLAALQAEYEAAVVYGALVGRVEMTDCVESHESPWFFGDFGFVLEGAEAFDLPVPMRGYLGIFRVDWP